MKTLLGLLLANGLVLAAPAWAKADPQTSTSTAPQPGSFGESIDVAVANVEVYVEDRQGRPVTGLEAADFELSEDGRPVALSNFFAVDGGRRLIEESTGLEGGPAPTSVERLPNVLVAYVDNANLSAFNRNRAMKQVEEFLRERMKLGDRVMVVSYAGAVQVEQMLTDSPRLVAAAVERLSTMTLVDRGPDERRRQMLDELMRLNQAMAGGSLSQVVGAEAGDAGPPQGRGLGMGGQSSQGDRPCEPQLGDHARAYARSAYEEVRLATEALGAFTDSLAGLPGRKSLLYVSDGLPATAGQEAFELLYQICGGGAAAAGAAAGAYATGGVTQNGGEGEAVISPDVVKLNVEALQLEAASFSATKLLRQLTDRANANRVTFFTLEAAGPRNTSASSAEVASQLESLQSVDFVAYGNLQDTLHYMADETGGRAVLNTADLGAALTGVATDLDTYYSLGYPSRALGAERASRIEVKVRRPGVEVRYRKSFQGKSSREQMADRTMGTLVFGEQENPIGVAVEVGQVTSLDGELFSVPIRLKIPIGKLVLLPQEGKRVGRLTVQVGARDRQGRLAPVRAAEIPLSIPEARVAEAAGKTFLYEVKMLMRSGDHAVAVGLRDELAQVASFVLAEVPVTPR